MMLQAGMNITAQWASVGVRRLPRIVFVVLLSWVTVCGASTNKVQVGVLPFVNLSGQTNLDIWCRAFPESLASHLQDARPPRVDAYFNKVLTQLTNNAWDGQQRISAELAAKVARELRLQKTLSGSFRQDEHGWAVELRIEDAGSDAKPQVLTFKEASTQRLLDAMTEGTCAAFGLKADPAQLELSRKHPGSNGAIDKLMRLHQAHQAGASKDELISSLRELLGSEPDYALARASLMETLLEANRQDEAMVEARKLIELASGLCWGYVGVASCQHGDDPAIETECEKALLQALKVHPGCPSAARMLFPVWTSQKRWTELRPVAEQAHELFPDEAVSTAALAAALAGEGDPDKGWDLLNTIDPLEEEDYPDTHATVLLAATGAVSMNVISRELLWLQRRSLTNDYIRGMVSDMDASFWLRSASQDVYTNSLPRLYSPEELQAELAKRLKPEGRALVENPLAVTDTIRTQARTLTAGLTNPATQATVLFGLVNEERLQTEQRATNSATAGPLPVCHQYASRLVALARSIGLPAWLVHVEFTSDEGSGYHDRAAIQLSEGQVIHFDPTLATLGSLKDHYRILDDLQAIAHHLLQEQDLAKLNVARKLDPDDPWTRLHVIMSLTTLDHLSEAERLWNALGPEYTNRWDYYFCQAQMEAERHRYASALECLNRADSLSSNNPAIQHQLGRIYGSLNDQVKAADHLERAMKLGAARRDPKQRAELESAVKFSRGVANAGRLTESQLRAQAAAGDAGAQLVLANTLLQRGEKEEALKWLLEGAKKGDEVCQAAYGRILFYTKGPAAAPEAVIWLRQAAQREHAEACRVLAVILYQGTGVPKDEAEASQWAHIGGAQGDKQCQSLMKEMQLFTDPAAFAEGKKRAEAMLSKKQP